MLHFAIISLVAGAIASSSSSTTSYASVFIAAAPSGTDQTNYMGHEQAKAIQNGFSALKEEWAELSSKSNDINNSSAVLDRITEQLKKLRSSDNGDNVMREDSDEVISSGSKLVSEIITDLPKFYSLAIARISGKEKRAGNPRHGGYRGSPYAPPPPPPPQAAGGYYYPYGQPVAGQAPGANPVPRPQQPNTGNAEPNTGGYKYQGGGDSDDGLNSQEGQASGPPHQQPAYVPAYPQPAYQPAYQPGPAYPQPAYQQPAYRQPNQEPSLPPQSSPSLNDRDGGPILRFAERITETILYQLEVVGSVFHRTSNRNSAAAAEDLLSKAHDAVQSYVSKIAV